MTPTSTFTRQQLEALDKASLIDLVLSMQEAMRAMQERLASLEAEVRSLRDQLAQHSRNSGKPPSSDGYAKPAPKSLRPKGRRKSGGQPGHKGHTLEMVERPDHVETHPVGTCPHCALDLARVPTEGSERRQAFDLPPARIEVTEHRVEVKRCPGCGGRVKGTFPPDVTQPTQYGARFKAAAVYLSVYQLLPSARIVGLFGDLFGHEPSEASLFAAHAAVADGIAPSLEAIRAAIRAAPVVHADETGLRTEGKLRWLHVAATKTATYYAIHSKRGLEAFREIGVLTEATGVLVHDGWAPYFRLEQASHALCNAHLLRELTFLDEEHGQKWAKGLSVLLRDMKEAVEATVAAGAWPSRQTTCWEHLFDHWLARGERVNPSSNDPPTGKRGRRPQSKARNLIDRLKRHKASVLAFLHDARIPFDNNQAERDLRMMKVKEKVSGCFRTMGGAQTFAAIRSYISTVRKQGGDVLRALHDALLGQPFIPAMTGLAE